MSSIATIQRMMVEQFDLKLEQLTPSAELASLGVDSLSIVEFMFNLEDELSIKFGDERMDFKTVQDVANIVDQLVAAQHGKA
ncbi:MAG: hypothetical protein RL358_387 [Pseudomonadota bacterium]|jgi:acyl carrier protein